MTASVPANPVSGNGETAQNVPAIPKSTAKPSVYKVKRRHPTNVDIPIDMEPTAADVKNEDMPSEVVQDTDPADVDIPYTDPVAHTVNKPQRENAEKAQEDAFVADGTVDERIFEDVMRRTRERVEKRMRSARRGRRTIRPKAWRKLPRFPKVMRIRIR